MRNIGKTPLVINDINTSCGCISVEYSKEPTRIYIPAQGSIIKMTPHNKLLYSNVIEWEQKKKLYLRGDTVLLGDSIIHKYCFLDNYYFVSGDKMINSQDSRYWGILPESFIVGRATMIWKSIDYSTGKIRWNRFLKRVK